MSTPQSQASISWELGLHIDDEQPEPVVGHILQDLSESDSGHPLIESVAKKASVVEEPAARKLALSRTDKVEARKVNFDGLPAVESLPKSSKELQEIANQNRKNKPKSKSACEAEGLVNLGPHYETLLLTLVEQQIADADPLLQMETPMVNPKIEFSTTKEYVDHFYPPLFEQFRIGLREDLLPTSSRSVISVDQWVLGFSKYFTMRCRVISSNQQFEKNQVVHIQRLSNENDKRLVTVYDVEPNAILLLFPCSEDEALKKAEIITITSSKWHCIQLSHIGVIFRNIKIFKNLHKLKYMKTILSPPMSMMKQLEHEKNLQDLVKNPRMGKYLPSFDRDQQLAIMAAVHQQEVTLIRGPSGTGKSHTILAIVRTFRNISHKARILVCAPDDITVDQLVVRINKDAKWETTQKRVAVRYGSNHDASEEAYVHYVDAIAELNASQSEQSKDSTDIQQLSKLRKSVFHLSKQLKREKLYLQYLSQANDQPNPQQSSDAQEQIEKISRLLEDENAKLHAFLQLHHSSKKYEKIKKDKHSILCKSTVVCTSLADCSSDDLLRGEKFQMVIVDNANQAQEIATLQVFKSNPPFVVLVGDSTPGCLPGPSALLTDDERQPSLYTRFVQNCYAKHELTTQYRMHPAISKIFSEVFYESMLLDHISVQSDGWTKPWHNAGLPPLALLDVSAVPCTPESPSNNRLYEAVIHLLAYWRLYDPSITDDYRVCVITITEMEAVAAEKYVLNRDTSLSSVEFKALHECISQEWDVCIFVALNLMQANIKKDRKSVSTILSRAKYSCTIISDCSFGPLSESWQTVYDRLSSSKSCFGVTLPIEDFLKGLPAKAPPTRSALDPKLRSKHEVSKETSAIKNSQIPGTKIASDERKDEEGMLGHSIIYTSLFVYFI
eukprot:TRINITY_DN6016_c0_g1_i3.p1 TRINITY_DN6016_c0_g1~~TRINITY_DN6016_c0_g1_i3.p1  ORF type:complete len:897 (-),score=144.64 TRINITY_DN6016_c0_g1_i3:952-3642(-)